MYAKNRMTWADFYLIVFLVGFILSAAAFLAGFTHIPHFHLHGHGHGHGGLKIGKSGLSPFNFATLAAFLAWFGGTGYLLERYATIWIYLGLFISSMSGLGGSALVFWFLMKLSAHEHPLDPADYDMVGVLGKVASPI